MRRSARSILPVAVTSALMLVVVLFGPMSARQEAYADEKVSVDKRMMGSKSSSIINHAGHDALSRLFRSVSKAVKPAVVEVRTVRKVERDFPGLITPFGDDDLPFRFGVPRRSRPRRRSYRQEGLGSGVIVDADKGYVLTNDHVVGDADEVEVVLSKGRKFKAQWVRSDPQSDLAVVKIEPDHLTEAKLGDSDEMAVGDWVLAIGSPKGLPQTVTAGIVSAKGRYNLGKAGMYQNLIQTDASINRGNSGGPLVNMAGEVIGISNMIVTSSSMSGNEGIGFAIPSNMAKDIMAQLIDNGKVVRGYLGVQIQDLEPEVARSMSLPRGIKGAVVVTVVPDSPADEAGLQMEDVIVSVNGRKTPNVNELRNVVASVRPGRSVNVVVYRDGNKVTLSAKTSDQPAELTARWRRRGGTSGKATAKTFGLAVEEATDALAEQYGYEDEVQGVIIVAVQEGSEAEQAGLLEGMAVTHVQGKALATVADFEKAIQAAKQADVVRLRIADPKGGARLVFLSSTKSP